MSDIDFEELNDKKDEFFIIDVRSPGELEYQGHIPGAHNIPLSELDEAMALEDEEFTEKYGFEKPKKDATVITLSQKVSELDEAMALEDEEFTEKYGFEKPKEDATVITLCQKGGRARKARELMVAAGFITRVYGGSFDDWKANGGEVEFGKP
ncbi:rhodanese domain-containing protein CG4456-like isoform X1 [Macrobrachium nipponense]|uniref:rhodanese domain-containing protein CG4456-like isoform X1 n=1 Tax=Macrobrachium nipponense TaxID=159736 RepID=UPI0030C7B50E